MGRKAKKSRSVAVHAPLPDLQHGAYMQARTVGAPVAIAVSKLSDCGQDIESSSIGSSDSHEVAPTTSFRDAEIQCSSATLARSLQLCS